MIGNRIDIAAAYLRGGDVVALPTETVYGLGCNALMPDAVAKVYTVKQRPSFDPLILHVDELGKITQYALINDELLYQIAKQYMPGPLTLLLPKKSVVPDMATAGSDRVAIRIPAHPITQKLLSRLDFPLAAPSANPFGYISPTTARHVDDQLGALIPYILDGGPCNIGVESTILGKENDNYIVYRKGGLAIEEIHRHIPNLQVFENSSSNPKAPGMLKSHYAPKAKFRLSHSHDLSQYENLDEVAFLGFDKFIDGLPQNQQILLSKDGNINKAAQNLFAALRKLDQNKYQIILAIPVPDSGLGKAINDRLRRASA